jgi:hypothetical protein
MRPAYSTAKTTIKAAACSNHPAIDGCEPLVSSATRTGFVPISHTMSSNGCRYPLPDSQPCQYLLTRSWFAALLSKDAVSSSHADGWCGGARLILYAWRVTSEGAALTLNQDPARELVGEVPDYARAVRRPASRSELSLCHLRHPRGRCRSEESWWSPPEGWAAAIQGSAGRGSRPPYRGDSWTPMPVVQRRSWCVRRRSKAAACGDYLSQRSSTTRTATDQRVRERGLSSALDHHDHP